ncbi:MAG TPA: hypothetical protein DDW98_09095 [Gammaproteobacteria bacterium]|nr:hypothetical protein [Gammaproteobacteria bacterium]
MTTIANKAHYVRQATEHDGRHHCHWPGCDKAVPPAMWGCKQHWFKLPQRLRSRVWATYRPGQEISKDPSAAYLAVADEVQRWIRENS